METSYDMELETYLIEANLSPVNHLDEFRLIESLKLGTILIYYLILLEWLYSVREKESTLLNYQSVKKPHFH